MSYSLSDQLPVDDPRQEVWKEQRKNRGFDNTELWNLDVTIAKFVLPRLKVFMDLPHVKADPDYYNNLLIVAKSFELVSEKVNFTTEEYKEIQEGLEMFSKLYTNLWY